MWDINAVHTNNRARISSFRLPTHAHASLLFSLSLVVVFPLSRTTSFSPLTIVLGRFSPSHCRPSSPSLVASLSFSSAFAATPATTKKRLRARSTLLNASTSPHSSFEVRCSSFSFCYSFLSNKSVVLHL